MRQRERKIERNGNMISICMGSIALTVKTPFAQIAITSQVMGMIGKVNRGRVVSGNDDKKHTLLASSFQAIH